jgi:prepilin-type N-terminal cleavage/methylation domain-containing protein
MWDAPAPAAPRCAGTTLIELIVVLALLGLVVGVSGLSLASLRPTAESQAVKELGRARAEAIRTGRPVHVLGIPGDSVASHTPHPTPLVTFLPDGRALGPGVDPLTGAPR